MKTRKTPIRFTGKTAYGLLSHIKRLILEEPLRYSQDHWLVTNFIDATHNLEEPDCGTVGCIAGWVIKSTGSKVEDTSSIAIPEEAGKILGIGSGFRYVGSTKLPINELFQDTVLTKLTNENLPPKQTKEYAELGAEHISRFQAKYKKQLLAKKVVVQS